MDWKRFGFVLLIIVVLFGAVVLVGYTRSSPILIITSMLATTIAVACPFCMTMMSDGVKHKNRETDIRVTDIAELIAEAQG